MNKYLIIGTTTVLSFLSCDQSPQESVNKEGNSSKSIIKKSIEVPTPVSLDTIFNNGDYIVVGEKGAKIALIEKRNPVLPSMSFPDTVYEDSKILIRGDFTKKVYVHILFNTRYRFESFPAAIYTGLLVKPDFTGNPYAKDSEYRMMIEDGCNENGINFGGHYTVITSNCGCMCQGIHLVDRMNGHIVADPGLSEGKWGYSFKPSSNLIVANAELLSDEKLCYYIPFGPYMNEEREQPELYAWKNGKFKKIKP